MILKETFISNWSGKFKSLLYSLLISHVIALNIPCDRSKGIWVVEEILSCGTTHCREFLFETMHFETQLLLQHIYEAIPVFHRWSIYIFSVLTSLISWRTIPAGSWGASPREEQSLRLSARLDLASPKCFLLTIWKLEAAVPVYDNWI